MDEIKIMKHSNVVMLLFYKVDCRKCNKTKVYYKVEYFTWDV